MTPRLLLLASAHTYRLEPFLKAAHKLGVDVVRGLDVPPAHTGVGRGVLGLDFYDPLRAVEQAQAYALEHPLQAVLATDDATVTLAAKICDAIDLSHNSPEATEAARDKFQMRQKFAQAKVPSPNFKRLPLDADPTREAQHLTYPCVLKPLSLSGSRGVIRADTPAEFVVAFQRIQALLTPLGYRELLVEDYLPGAEVALEGLLDHGRLKVLALFDKPDPLEGPFFEETIYVTPSRLPAATQQALIACTERAAQALGLREGPVHAELRLNETGPWMLEIAGRSIGGLCSQTLRFGTDLSLEELIIRQALGLPIADAQREQRAGGVMMIPIPRGGVLTEVRGLTEAEQVTGIESIEITAKINYPITPLPEGDSYLGFIFAQGETPVEAEAALREAHAKLEFVIEEALPVL